MANNVKPFSSLEISGEGNVVRDAKFFEGSGDSPSKLFVSVAFNTKNYQGAEETQYFDVHFTGFLADQAKNSLPKKGQRIVVSGRVYPSKDFDQYKGWTVESTRPLAFSTVFQDVQVSKSEYNKGGSDGSSSREQDHDDAPIEQSTSRSRDNDDMGDAGLPDNEAPARGRGRGRGRGRSALD